MAICRVAWAIERGVHNVGWIPTPNSKSKHWQAVKLTLCKKYCSRRGGSEAVEMMKIPISLYPEISSSCVEWSRAVGDGGRKQCSHLSCTHREESLQQLSLLFLLFFFFFLTRRPKIFYCRYKRPRCSSFLHQWKWFYSLYRNSCDPHAPHLLIAWGIIPTISSFWALLTDSSES